MVGILFFFLSSFSIIEDHSFSKDSSTWKSCLHVSLCGGRSRRDRPGSHLLTVLRIPFQHYGNKSNLVNWYLISIIEICICRTEEKQILISNVICSNFSWGVCRYFYRTWPHHYIIPIIFYKVRIIYQRETNAKKITNNLHSFGCLFGLDIGVNSLWMVLAHETYTYVYFFNVLRKQAHFFWYRFIMSCGVIVNMMLSSVECWKKFIKFFI